ncbi:ISAs1 family transposase [Trinickia violacea]|uniref:ISAs1 family transposase n=1 Tax=Trinickia violacea TaxID=2571746 RepID=A0A4P8J0W3_9BURK|nr:ISAs1 family transposase [Trinickia violacea]QCP54407.1 ISAs1 family transposase [Trinickia violacea]
MPEDSGSNPSTLAPQDRIAILEDLLKFHAPQNLWAVGEIFQAVPWLDYTNRPDVSADELRARIALARTGLTRVAHGLAIDNLNTEEVRASRNGQVELEDQDGELVSGRHAVRGSHQRGERAIHLVSAYGSGLGVVLEQVRTADKSNEIAAIPELLDALVLKGTIVPIDAMGCQQTIARQIVQAGADYVLAVKKNHPTLSWRVQQALKAAERLAPAERSKLCSEYREVDKDHGRIETRWCMAIRDPRLAGAHVLPWAHSVAVIESTREIGDAVTTERHYFVSSLPPDVKRIARAVRAHCRIENNLHWCLDVVFGEDQCRVRVDNAAQNFAILRRIVMNLLKHDHKTKAGLKIRRLKVATSDLHREQILGW